MDAIQLLHNYKKKLDKKLKGYFQKKALETGKIDSLAQKAVKMIADFTLANGKRVRPALVYYAYLACGGEEKEKIMEASMGIELTHSFLLIHDDIIDRDAKRHGVPTIHERYKKIGRRLNIKKDCLQFGNSMAMLTGDMASAMANEIIFNSRFRPETVIKALDKLQRIVYNIVPGEMLDVVMEMRGRTDEKEVLKMYESKTASYSFEGPLHLGAVFSERYTEKNLNDFSEFARSVGKAFQIRDDIIGLFGAEKKIGKPIGSDVTEGKQTILVVKALDMGNKSQKNAIKKYLGKSDLKKGELAEFREAVKGSGSLEYCENLAQGFVSEALDVVDRMVSSDPESKEFFSGIAKYAASREL